MPGIKTPVRIAGVVLDTVLIVIGIVAIGLGVILGRRGRDRVGVKRGVGQDWRDRREAEAGVSPRGAGASTIHVPEKQGRLAFRIASIRRNGHALHLGELG